MSLPIPRVSLLAIAAALSAGVAQAATKTVSSPDGRIQVIVEYGDNGVTYAVSRDGKAIISPSSLGLRTDKGAFGQGPQTLKNAADRSVNETFQLVVGKTKDVADRYNESTLTFAQDGATPLTYSVVVRAYDSGAAVRYAFDAKSGLGSDVAVTEESTRYMFAADYDCWGLNLGRFNSSHEGEFDKIKTSQIRVHNLFDYPLVCKTGEGTTTFALAEADVENYPASLLSRIGGGDNDRGVQVITAPRPDNDPGARQRFIAAKLTLTNDAFQTPWRVVMIGDTPGALTASTLIPQLAAPSRIKDKSWIKPGKAAWDWWNGWSVNTPNPGVNTESYKAYIDFAKEAGLEYILIDEGWSVGSSTEANPNADLTMAKPEMDMPAIVKYAKDRGIGVWVWAQWQQLDQQMDAALDQFQAWGLKGVKVDFMDRSDQAIVDYYHKLLGKAADRKLMIDLHGAFAPTGLNRTYPNYMTQEGVMGAEYNKWSKRVTATHNVTLPYTRMILGPIDYTPGGFRSVKPSEFSPRSKDPFVQTTRGQAVAMYVVYDSPFNMLADSPGAYKKPDGSWADGAQFIAKTPVTWDETRVLSGDIGQSIVMARRSGDTWYVGAMTNEDGRTVTVPLSFLKAGNYKASLLQDGADVNSLNVSEQTVDAGQSLTLTLAPSGGAAVTLTPAVKVKKKKK